MSSTPQTDGQRAKAYRDRKKLGFAGKVARGRPVQAIKNHIDEATKEVKQALEPLCEGVLLIKATLDEVKAAVTAPTSAPEAKTSADLVIAKAALHVRLLEQRKTEKQMREAAADEKKKVKASGSSKRKAAPETEAPAQARGARKRCGHCDTCKDPKGKKGCLTLKAARENKTPEAETAETAEAAEAAAEVSED